MTDYLGTPVGRDIFERLLQGQSVRSVAKEVGVSKVTVSRYRGIILGLQLLGAENFEIKDCPCGQPAGHTAWCGHRYQSSPKRQQMMKRLHQNQRK